MSGKKNFEGFETLFGEVAVEQGSPTTFVFYVRALDSSRLEIVATDFHSLTFSRILTVHELEDLRDDTGIGGSWSEFVDYVVASLSSGDVKLNLCGLPDATVDSGFVHAKLIARKSKGLPHMSLSLNQLIGSSANDAKANLSLGLFRAFKNKHDTFVKEQEQLVRLKGLLSSERERNESLQKQLDAVSFLSKRKVSKSKASDRVTPVSDTLSNYGTSISEIQDPSDIPSTTDPQSTKVSQRAAPANRRAKVRGVSLQDTGDIDDN